MSEQPNVVLVVTDQQRFDTLRCYGFDAGHTPNLDRLAGQGAIFDAAYCPSPLCTPSRASLFTGKPVAGHGVERLYDTLPDDEVLFPQRLREAGYRTGLFGKLHVSSRADESERRHPQDGFDVYEWCNEPSLDMESPWHAYDGWLREQDPAFHERVRREGRGVTHYPRHLHMSHWVVERALGFVEEAASTGRPFFAYLGFFDPHNPYDGAPRHFGDLIGDLPPVRQPAGTVPTGLRREMESKTVAAHVRDGDLEAARIGYHAAVALIDAEVGRLLERLDALGLSENTLVVFTSDHGEMLGDRRLMTKGAFFYEPCVRVPMLVRHPGYVPAGARVAGPVTLADVAATVLHAAGVVPADVEGIDLRLVAAGEVAPHAFVTSSYRNGGVAIGEPTTYFDPPVLATMIRTERYKLVRYHDGSEPAGQLFDLQADPQEERDLWEDSRHAGVRAELTGTLLDQQVRDHWRAGPRGGERLPAASLA